MDCRHWIALLLGCAAALHAQPESDFTPPRGAIYGMGRVDDGPWQKRLMTAVSTDGVTFTRTNQVVTDQANVPDLVAGPDGVLYLYYSGGTVGDRKNVIAAAVSKDHGRTWAFRYVDIAGIERMPPPGDPDVRLLPDGTFRLYFTSALFGSRIPSIFYAEGTDGLHFTYRGQVLSSEDEPVIDSFTVPIRGKWHMYTLGGQGDTLWHATSADGVVFTVVDRPRFRIGREPYIPTNEIELEDGRVRFYAFRPFGSEIRSFVTEDGYTWEAEPGVRLALDTSAGLEKDFVKDVAVIRLADGSYLMIYVTVIPD